MRLGDAAYLYAYVGTPDQINSFVIDWGASQGVTDEYNWMLRGSNRVLAAWEQPNIEYVRNALGYGEGYRGTSPYDVSIPVPPPNPPCMSLVGNVYIADRENNRIRIVDSGGTIDTLVSGLLKPVDVAVDQAANVLYFTEEVDPFVNRSR